MCHNGGARLTLAGHVQEACKSQDGANAELHPRVDTVGRPVTSVFQWGGLENYTLTSEEAWNAASLSVSNTFGNSALQLVCC